LPSPREVENRQRKREPTGIILSPNEATGIMAKIDTSCRIGTKCACLGFFSEPVGKARGCAARKTTVGPEGEQVDKETVRESDGLYCSVTQFMAIILVMILRNV
jgi:hypothetical protein